MVRGHDDRLDALWLAELVFHRDLGLAVRTQERELAALADLGQLPGKPVGERDRERHQLRGLPAREADHHALVAGTLELERIGVAGALALLERMVDTRRDVG